MQKDFKQDCPYCSAPQILSHYTTVDVKLQPDLKVKVLSGKLNAQACKDCAKEISFISPFLYHDADNSFMIQFNPAEKMDELTLSKIKEDLKGRGYIHREVQDYADLREKIEIFNLGMNDEVIEKIKDDLRPLLYSSLKASLGKLNSDEEIHIFFEQYETNEKDNQLSFAFFINPSQVMGMKCKVSSLSEENQQGLFDISALRN